MASDSICRTRSRLIRSLSPISASVYSVPSINPYRKMITCVSRGFERPVEDLSDHLNFGVIEQIVFRV